MDMKKKTFSPDIADVGGAIVPSSSKQAKHLSRRETYAQQWVELVVLFPVS
jgi:hypothetical protein